MKKLICIALCLAMTLALSACACAAPPIEDTTPTTLPTPATEPTTPTSPTTEPTTAPTTEPTTEPTVDIGGLELDLSMVSISLSQQSELTVNEQNKTVFEYVYQNVRLQLDDAIVSNTVVLDLLNRIDQTRSAADSIRQSALSNGIGAAPFSYKVLYTPQRIDSGVLSLSSVTTSYSGGAHGGVTCGGVTYDLTTGAVLSLADILADSVTADVICRLAVDALMPKFEELYLFDDFNLTVEDRFSGNFLADSAWYLSQEGLCFSFAPYDLAPYSAGVVTAVIPYAKLPGILEDAYFPAEQVYSNSNLCGIRFDQSTEDEFSRFAELEVNPDGETVLLYTNGLVYDIVIETGRWNTAGTVFTPESTVFTASSLTPGEAILITAHIPEERPGLRISYTKGEETVYAYLCSSSKGGTSILTD